VRGATAEEIRQKFLKLIDRPKVDAAPEIVDQATDDAGVTRFHYTFASEEGQRVPVIALAKELILHDGNKHPVVIVLHGTGGKKEGEEPFLKKMVAKDFIAVAIDGRYHGERGTPADYNGAIAAAFAKPGAAHPMYYDTVWDVLRLIDHLEARPEVDARRIGLMGISKGGIETYLAAAADTRIAAAIPCISLQSFQWGLDNDAWHNRVGTVKTGFAAAAKSAGVANPDAAFVREFYDKVLPGIHAEFDGPSIVPLIAPRACLAISGDIDPINPLPGARLCEEAAKNAYAAAGVPEKFQLLVEAKTGHAVTKESESAAVAWFVKWLGTETK